MAAYIFGAPPRWGKTMSATRWALKRLADNARRRKKNPKFVGEVFSNYPIYSKKYGYTKALYLTPEQQRFYGLPEDFEKWPIFDSLIVVDESHRRYNSRKYKDFPDWMHDFFAWCGQRGNDIILISHDPGRIDKVAREMVEVFYFTYKISIFGFPIIFVIEGYLTEEDYRKRQRRYSREFYFFSRKVSKSYDTHHFRNQPETLPHIPDWGELISRQIIETEPQEPHQEDLLD
jgi:hypothetical protein